MECYSMGQHLGDLTCVYYIDADILPCFNIVSQALIAVISRGGVYIML